MEKVRDAHPSLEQLTAFDLGRLRPTEWEVVERHLSQCAVCWRKLETVPDDSLAALLRSAAGAPLPAAGAGPAVEQPDQPPLQTPTCPSAADVPAALVGHPRYRVLGVLGAGGMGTVYKAEHRVMERVIALKVIRKELLDRPDAVERFALEVKAAARLAHPNIVTAHDAEQAGDVHFLVMEFVEGVSLDLLVQRQGPVPLAPACHWIRQAAEGLQHAFERGMVHRDIKPANLLLTPEGRVKILDFGLARFVRETTPSAVVTQPGMVVGTPDYMAPEQALDSRHADIRADIYSLGCTLYYLLTARPPFPEGTYLQKLMARQTRLPQPVTELRGDVPPRLAGVLQRMLATDPSQRYQTPAEVVRELAPFAQPAGAPDAELCPCPAPAGPPAAPVADARSWEGPRPRRIGRRRWLVLSAAMVLLPVGALLGVVGWHLLANRDRGVEGQPESAAPSGLPLSPRVGEIRCIDAKLCPFDRVVFAPDCRHALTACPDESFFRLWDLESGKQVGRFVGHTGPVLSLAFSPDGRQVLSGSQDTTIRVWNVADRTLLKTLRGHTSWVRAASFCPDGRHVVSGGNDAKVMFWDIDSGRRLEEFKGHLAPVSSVAVSPSGRLAVSASFDKTIRVWDLLNRERVQTYQGHEGTVSCAVFSRDGRYILSGSMDQTARLWRLTADGEVRRFQGHANGINGVALAPDGRRALSAGFDRTVRHWDVESGKEVACLQGHTERVVSVAFCPDGRRAWSGGRDGTLRLWQLPEPDGP
jgi:tRNA A-37 threonylcarbamoyl transferase component Bud32